MDLDKKKETIGEKAEALKNKRLKRKEEPTEWKSDRIRAERRARLQQLKNKDGGKKPIRTKSKGTRIVALVLALIVLLVIGVWVLFRFGVPQRTLAAFTVNGEKITATETNVVMAFHAAQQFQMQMMYLPENQAMLDGDAGDGIHTYRDILVDAAVSELKYNVTLAQQMKEDGFELSDEEQTNLDLSLQGLEQQFMQQAAQAQVPYTMYLESTFGPGASIEDVKDYYSLSTKVRMYLANHFENVDVKEEDIDKYYADNKDQLDYVNYYLAEFKAVYDEDADDAAKDAAREAVQAKAEDMVSRLEGADNFYELALELTEDETARKNLERHPEGVYHMFDLHGSNRAPAAVRDYVFDEARKAGDTEVLESGDSRYVVLFESRAKADLYPYSVRHILVKADRAQAPDAEIKAAKEKAEDLLKQYEDGAKTEESFAELAIEHSEDGNATQGGIYENINAQEMVTEFERWALDSNRKAGDTTIVQSQFGFHVMYFVGHNLEGDPYWMKEAKDGVAGDETIAWRDAILEKATLTGGSAQRMVGKQNVFSILFGKAYNAADHGH